MDVHGAVTDDVRLTLSETCCDDDAQEAESMVSDATPISAAAASYTPRWRPTPGSCARRPSGSLKHARRWDADFRQQFLWGRRQHA